MQPTVPHSGMAAAAVTLLQFLPPSRVTWTRPSSLPAQSRPFCLRRFGDGEDGVVNLDAGVVAGDGAAGPCCLVLSLRVRSGLICCPGLAGVGRFEQHVGGVIDRLRIVRRDQDRGGPLEAIVQIGGGVAGRIEGIDADVPGLAGAVVVARDVAAVFAGIDDVGIGRIGGGEAGLAAADGVPVGQGDAGRRQAVARAGCAVPMSCMQPET